MSTERQKLPFFQEDECFRQLLQDCHALEREMGDQSAERFLRGSLREVKVSKVDVATRAGSFVRFFFAVATFVGFLCLVTGALWLAAKHRAIPDQRLGLDYRDHTLSTITASSTNREVYVGTADDGLHVVRAPSEFIRSYSNESTDGGLLADCILKAEIGEDNLLYLLCRDKREPNIGLCRFDPIKRSWKTMIGMDRFPELTNSGRTARITDVAVDGDLLYIATDMAGLGVYHSGEHRWRKIYRAGNGLRSNEIRDLQSIAGQGLYVASANGVQLLQDELWSDIELPEPRTQSNPAELAESEGNLFLRTLMGGLYRLEGDKWVAIAPESNWGEHSDRDIQTVLASADDRRWWFLARDRSVGEYNLFTRGWRSLPAIPAPGICLAERPFKLGGLLAGTSAGVFELAEGDDDWKPLTSSGPVAALSVGHSGVLIGTTSPDKKLPMQVQYNRENSTPAILVGKSRAAAASTVVTASVDSTSSRLLVGGKDGISTYDLGTHSWSRPVAPPLLESVLELQPTEKGQLVLCGDSTVGLWNPSTDGFQHLLGGGQLPKSLNSVTAVTRTSKGDLFLAGPDGLFVYETTRHFGRRVASLPGPVREMCAEQSGIWLLIGGLPFFSSGSTLTAASEPPAPLERLFAAPDSTGAVGLDAQGRVTLYTASDIQPKLLVGDAAPGLDLNAVNSAVLCGEKLVVGGLDPYLYDVPSRTWTKLAIGRVMQVVASSDATWLRTADRKLFRLGIDQSTPEEQPNRRGTVALASNGRQVAVLQDDYSIWALMPESTNWLELKSAAAGPPPALLNGPRLLVAGGTSVLDLVGEDGVWWRFDWKTDGWRSVRGDSIGKISHLASTADTTYALSGGQLFEANFLIDAAKKMPVNEQFESLRAAGSVVLAVDNQSCIWRVGPDGIQRLTGSPIAGSGALRDVAASRGGLVVTTGSKSAILGPDLASWREIPGTEIQQLYSSGGDVYGVDQQERLWRLNADVWQPQMLGTGKAGVRSVVEQAGSRGHSLTVTTRDGAVFRVESGAIQQLRKAGPELGSANDVVAIVPAADGVLCAMRTGKLWFCRESSLEWSTVEGPDATGYLQLLTTGSGEKQCCWLLTADRKVFVKKTAGGGWEPRDEQIQRIVAANDDLLATNTKGEVVRLGAHGNRTMLVRASPPPNVALPASRNPTGKIIAAGELVADNRSLLLLSDGKRTAVYDPKARQWSSLELPAIAFQKARADLIALTAANTATRLTWANGQLTTAEIIVPAGAKPAGELDDSGRLVARFGNASVGLVNDTGRLQLLTNRDLQVDSSTQVIHVAAHGYWLFVALSDKSVRGYHFQRREWRLLGRPGDIVRLEAFRDQAWVETKVDNGRQLSVWCDGDADFTTIEGQLLVWHVTPVGIAAALSGVTSPKVGLWDGPQDFRQLPIQLPPGPSADQVTAARANDHGLWLKTKDQMFQYDHGRHLWTLVSPQPGFVPVAAHFRGKFPLLHDQTGRLWTGSSPVQNATSSFVRGPAEVLQADAFGDVFVFQTADTVASARFESPAERLGELKRTSAWAKQSAPSVATANGGQLVLANVAGEVARYDLSRRSWTQLAKLPGDAARLFWLQDQLHAFFSDGRAARWNDSDWEPAADVARPEWHRGDQTWKVHPLGGVSEANETKESVEVVRELTSTEPVRCELKDKQLWLEMADGSLLQYDADARRLRQRAPPCIKAGIGRTGLIKSGGNLYFVAEDEGRVLFLNPEAPALGDQIKLNVKRVLTSNDSVALDSDSELQVFPGNKLLRGTEREGWLKASSSPDSKRMLTSGDWRISGDGDGVRRLERKLESSWIPYPLDSKRARFKWDDIHGGLTWGERTLATTSAGVLVWGSDPTTEPVGYLPVDAAEDSPLSLYLLRFDDSQIVLASNDGRLWRLPEPSTEKSLELKQLEAPTSVWRCGWKNGKLDLHLLLDGEKERTVSLSSFGTLGIDQFLGVGLQEKSVLVATEDGLLEMSADLKQILSVVQAGPGEIAPNPRVPGILFRRKANGVVLSHENGLWRPAEAALWDQAVRVRDLVDRVDPVTKRVNATAKIEFPLALSKAEPPRTVEYRKGLLSCDVLGSSGGRALFTSDGVTFWRGNSIGVLASSLAQEDDGHPAVMQFVPIPGGVADFQWQTELNPPQLRVISADGRSYRLEQGKAIPEEAPLSTNFAIWGDARYSIDKQPRLVSLSKAGGTAPLMLDLELGGFRQDQVVQVAPSLRVIWQVVEGGSVLERITPGREPKAERFQLPSAGAIQIRRMGNQLFADDGTRMFRLPDEGTCEPVSLDLSAASRLRKGFEGTRWRIDQLASLAGVALRKQDGQWLSTEYRPGGGFLWDLWGPMLVADGDLYLATPQGAFLQTQLDVSLDATMTLPLLNDQDTPQIAQLLIGTEGRICAQTSAGWQRLTVDKKSWEAMPALPQADEELGRVLCSSAKSAWVRTPRGIEFRAYPKKLVVEWNAKGFAINDIVAAVETPQGLWMLARGGLWMQSSTGLSLGDTREVFKGRDGSFRKQGNSWRMNLGGTTPSTFINRGDGWSADDLDPASTELVWEQPTFRVRANEGGWNFEIRGEDDRWIPAKFDSTLGMFSFQIARDAAKSDKFLHTLSRDGVVTWSVEPAGLAFRGLRTEFKELGVHPETKVPLARSADNQWRSFDGVDWKPIISSAGVLHSEVSWRVIRVPEQSASVQRIVGTEWTDLPLASKGDFQYRRPTAIALHENKLWTMSNSALAHYSESNSPTIKTSSMFGLSMPFNELFELDGALYAAAGDKLMRSVASDNWEAADPKVSRTRLGTIVSTDGWRWTRDDRGRAQITRILAGGEQLMVWDRAEGRFTVDRVHDVALSSEEVLLSTAAGVAAVVAKTGESVGMITDTAIAGRFAYDRMSERLLWRAQGEESSALPLNAVQSKRAFGPPVALTSPNCFTHSYLDPEWSFQLGATPQVSWHGLKSGLVDGRFHHDMLRGMLVDGKSCWLESAAGLVVYSSAPEGLRWSQHIRWPSAGEGRLLAIKTGRPLVQFKQGIYSVDPSADKALLRWEAVETDPSPERVLVDTPFWKWTRNESGTCVSVKPSDQTESRDLLRFGSFPFDDVCSMMSDDSDLWLGVREGLVLRSASDGSFVRWHTMGNTPQGPVPLGRIVRIGRFNAAGDPIPEAADRALQETSTLFAMNEASQCWQWDGSTVSWTSAASNPWTGPWGSWVFRSPSLQASSTSDGSLVMTCRLRMGEDEPSAAAPVAINKGRLTSDVVRGVTSVNSQLYLATDAGLVCTSPTGSFAKLWPKSADSKTASLAGARAVSRHQQQNELFCVASDGEYFRLDRAADSWNQFMPDATYRNTAEVLHQNDFWTWRRWAGEVDMSIERSDVKPYDGPIFIDGRFAFDVVRDVHMAHEGLFALTAAGVIKFDPKTMDVLSLSRRAFDPAANEQLQLPNEITFTANSEAVLETTTHEFRYQDGQWIRTKRLRSTKERQFDDAGRRVTVSQVDPNGVVVTIHTSTGSVIWQGAAFTNVAADQIVGVVWLNGELWVTTKNQTFRWRAPLGAFQ